MEKIDSQNKNILTYLKKGGKITQMEALVMFGCFRLSGRIYDLKKLGYNIKAEKVTKNKKTFCQYSLA